MHCVSRSQALLKSCGELCSRSLALLVVALPVFSQKAFARHGVAAERVRYCVAHENSAFSKTTWHRVDKFPLQAHLQTGRLTHHHGPSFLVNHVGVTVTAIL